MSQSLRAHPPDLDTTIAIIQLDVRYIREQLKQMHDDRKEMAEENADDKRLMQSRVQALEQLTAVISVRLTIAVGLLAGLQVVIGALATIIMAVYK